MKVLVSLILAVCTIQALQAQDSERLTIDLNETSLEEAFGIIEANSDYRFYYASEWIDSLRVDGVFRDLTIEELLQSITENTRLKFAVLDNRVVITRDISIRTQLPTDYFSSGISEDSPSEVAFLREYAPVDEVELVTEQLVEIGSPNAFVANGSSTVAGYVKELATGEPILGAYVFVTDPFIGATTDYRGFFSLTLPNGPHQLTIQYVGMKELKQDVHIYSDGTSNFEMIEDIVALKEVTIESERDVNVNSVQMGLSSIDIKSIKNVPMALGEPDVLKVALTLPGVQTVGEGSAGYNVRGGGADQNLFTLNGATIFNPNHFFGFFSALNASVIKKLDLYKSSIPAQYGSRLSSIFDVQMIDGNQKKVSGSGTISPITAGLTVQGPIIKDKTTFVLGGRGTYSDWVLNLLPESSSLSETQASFYDVVAKVTHEASPNDFINVSGYYSKDKFRLTSDSIFSYHNANASVQWRHNFSNKFIGRLSGSYSEYDYNIDHAPFEVESFRSGYRISETDFKLDLGYYQSSVHKFDFGFQGKLYDLNPGFIEPTAPGSEVIPEQVQEERGIESAFYLSDNIEINTRLSVYLGLRYSFFTALGPRDVYTYLPESSKEVTTIIDTTSFAAGKALKTYQGPEYRVSAKYSINSETSIKVSYNRTRQYLHLLSNSISVSPTDTWKLSDVHIAPQIGDQYSLGLYRNINNNSIETSVEAYYKDMQNILDYKDAADLTLNQFIETDVIQGQGRAYGVELLARKKKGKLNGWASYTYSRTHIRLDGDFPSEQVNDGSWFPANYDKPHDFTLVSNYRLTRRYSIATNFTYSTGRPITYPIAKYEFGGGEKIHFSERNQFRIPDYIRVDIGVNIEGNHRVNKLGHSFWNISIYNLLGRKNVYSIFFNTSDGEISATQLSVFGAPIPTISYNFTF